MPRFQVQREVVNLQLRETDLPRKEAQKDPQEAEQGAEALASVLNRTIEDLG